MLNTDYRYSHDTDNKCNFDTDNKCNLDTDNKCNHDTDYMQITMQITDAIENNIVKNFI